jgi:PRTRC genetic system protein C
MKTTVNKRRFVHNGATLNDPDVAMSPAAVKDLYSAMYPELLNAEIQGPELVADELVFTFHRTTGTKGRSAKAVRGSTKCGKKAALKEVSPFVRRLMSAATETSSPSSALPPSELKTLQALMTPVRRGQPLSLPSSSFALLL